MATYAWRGMDANGRMLRGQMQAANIADLESRLARLSVDLVDSREQNPSAGLKLGRKRIRRGDLIQLCFHLEQLTSAGVPLLEGIADIRDSSDNQTLRDILADVVEAIEAGETLSGALRRHDKVFDTTFISLVKAGEESGELPRVFGHLSEALKWQDEIAAAARMAATYPIVAGTVITAVLAFLMSYLMPQLIPFIIEMGGELPIYTRVLIWVSDAFTAYWYLILGTPLVTTALTWLAARVSTRFRMRLDEWKLSVPRLGDVFKHIALSRFARFFSLMYAAGVSVVEAMRLCEGMLGNTWLQDGVRRAGVQIINGEGISASFESVGLFPPLVVRMIRVGEVTGGLDKALDSVCYFYDRQVREDIDQLQAMIGPALTAVMGLFLGWVMLSVMGPVYDLIANLQI